MSGDWHPLEETSKTQDHERRREKRGKELLAYISRMDHGRLIVNVHDGTVATWRHLKDREPREPGRESIR